MAIQPKDYSYNRIAIATCFGTFLEWYDFLVFANLAVIFGSIFFPSTDPNTALLASLATFGIGMIIRPIGSAIFGSLGDKIGRKPVFITTIILMGLATVSIGFLPTYAQVGIWAPILLIGLRILQGISAGGEIGGGAIYLAEHAGNAHRGLKTSFLQLMGPLGIMASTIQIAILQKYLSLEQFYSWGWRVPFWISFLLLLVAFYVRKSVGETPVFLEISREKSQTQYQLINNFKTPEIRKRMFLLFFCISSSGAILFFCTQVYVAIFLKTTVNLESNLVDQLCIISSIALFPLIVLAGSLSDRYGRKTVMLCGIILSAILLYPAFGLLEYLGLLYIQNSEPIAIMSLAAVLVSLSSLLALTVGPQTALLAELFPAKNRNSAATLPHNLAAGWIGGLLPLIMTWLNQIFASSLAGLCYPVIFLTCAGLAAYFYLPETNSVALEK
ncbi:MFS transporter [Polynucleobacter sp. MWH-UH19D]|uniref:MFS transporter n=1 Tax=Polynucleobacter sp. MWH-UH19D TaxID=1855610 RepID=UPI003364BC3E